jgi:hypothetical protein
MVLFKIGLTPTSEQQAKKNFEKKNKVKHFSLYLNFKAIKV